MSFVLISTILYHERQDLRRHCSFCTHLPLSFCLSPSISMTHSKYPSGSLCRTPHSSMLLVISGAHVPSLHYLFIHFIRLVFWSFTNADILNEESS